LFLDLLTADLLTESAPVPFWGGRPRVRLAGVWPTGRWRSGGGLARSRPPAATGPSVVHAFGAVRWQA